MKSRGTRELALCACFTAIAVVINLLTSLFPTMSLTLLAISGLVTAVAVSECGLKRAGLVYLAASVLSLFIVLDKQNVMLYIFLFGHYPIIKSIIERIRNPVVAWVIKMFSANVLIIAVFIVIIKLLGIEQDTFFGELMVSLLISNAAFVLYDICMTRLMLIHATRSHKRR